MKNTIQKILIIFVGVICFSAPQHLLAGTVGMLLTVQPSETLTFNGQLISPVQSVTQTFNSSGGVFKFTNADGSFIEITFFTGTTQVTLDFSIDSYDQGSIIASHPLPTGKNVVGVLIYNMRTFVGATEKFTFDDLLSIRAGYTDAILSGLKEETLNIYFWNETQNIWTPFSNVTRDLENNTATILTDHLTLFAVLGEGVEVVPQVPSGGGVISGLLSIFAPKIVVAEEVLEKISEEVICRSADINLDDKVDLFDFGIFVFFWGSPGSDKPCADIDGNNIIGLVDFGILVFEWRV